MRKIAALLAILLVLMTAGAQAETAQIESLTLNTTSVTLFLGNMLQLVAYAQPEAASEQPVTWSSGNRAIARVDENGLVTPVKAGSVTITCRAQSGGAKATCRVKVTRVYRRALIVGRSSRVKGPDFIGGSLPAVYYEILGVTRAMKKNRIDGYGINVSMALNKSKAYVRAAIKRKFAGSKENDVNYLYFSGHGTSVGGEFYMIPSTGYSISASELRRWLDAIPGKFMVVVNTCNSGAVIGKGGATSFAQGFLNGFLASSAKGGSLADDKYMVLCSSTGSQDAYTATVKVDIFGLAFASGMGYDYIDRALSWLADLDGDGDITFGEMFAYARTRVNELSDRYQVPRQTVTVYPDGGSGEVLFSYRDRSF